MTLTKETMNKYYFISYIAADRGYLVTYGHCVMTVKCLTLDAIAKKIAEVNGFSNPVSIICMKDLSKKEFEMLGGIKQ